MKMKMRNRSHGYDIKKSGLDTDTNIVYKRISRHDDSCA